MSLPVNLPDATPAELLREFVVARSGEAFAELVRRYAGLVTGTAARVTGSRETAEDVAQEVFALLARKASAVDAASLGGSLHRVSVRRAAAARRRSNARARRDLAAFMNTEMVSENAPDPQWAEVPPALDRALDSMPAEDRAVVLLRYYEQLSWHEIAARLPLTAEAARKRTKRAIERLGRTLKARGLSTTAAALAAGLAAQWKAEAAMVSPYLAAQALTKSGTLPARVVLTTTLATMRPARWAGLGVAAACLMAGSLALRPLLHPPEEKERPEKTAKSIVDSIAAARPAPARVPSPNPGAQPDLGDALLNGAVDVFQENISPVNEDRLVEIKVNQGDKVPPQTVVSVMDSSKYKLDLESLRRGIIADRLNVISDQEDKLIKLDSELRQLQTENAEDSAINKALENQVQASILSIGKIRDTFTREKEIFTKYDLLNPEVTQSNALRDDEYQKLEELKASLENCEIRTATGGTVDLIGKEAGELVRPGEGILKIIDDPRQVVCFLPQDQSWDVKAGDTARVASTVDKEQIFETTVISVSPRINNLADATSLLGSDIVLDYPTRPVPGYPDGAIKDGRFLLLPGQTVIVHLSKPRAN